MEKKRISGESLDPQHKKIISYVGLGMICLILVAAILGDDKPIKRNNEVQHVLTDVKSKDMGIESLLAQIKIANDNVKKLESELNRINKEQDLIRSESSANRSALSRVSQLEKDFKEQKTKQKEQIEALSHRLTKNSELNMRLKKAVDGNNVNVFNGAKQGLKGNNAYNQNNYQKGGYQSGGYQSGSVFPMLNTGANNAPVSSPIPEFKKFDSPSTDPLKADNMDSFYVESASNADNKGKNASQEQGDPDVDVKSVTPDFKIFKKTPTEPIAQEQMSDFYIDNSAQSQGPTSSEVMPDFKEFNATQTNPLAQEQMSDFYIDNSAVSQGPTSSEVMPDLKSLTPLRPILLQKSRCKTSMLMLFKSNRMSRCRQTMSTPKQLIDREVDLNNVEESICKSSTARTA